MDCLSPEVVDKVLSFIPYGDLLPLRLVNKQFNRLIEGQFTLLTSIMLTTKSSPVVRTSISINFNKTAVRFIVKDRYENISGLLAFLKRTSAPLQLMDFTALICILKLSDLTPFGRSLKYLRMGSLELDIFCSKTQLPERLMELFPALEAFEMIHPIYPFCPRLWMSRANNNFSQWDNECRHANFVCPPSVDRFIPKSIKFLVTTSGDGSFDLAAHASTLEVIQICGTTKGLPSSRIEFPSLKSLNISSTHRDIEGLIHLITSSQQLRHLCLSLEQLPCLSSLSLLSLVQSLPCLKTFEIEAEIVKDGRKLSKMTAASVNNLKFLWARLKDPRPEHVEWVKNLLASSPPVPEIDIKFINSEFGVQKCRVRRVHFKDATLLLDALDVSSFRGLLSIVHKHHVKTLTLRCEKPLKYTQELRTLTEKVLKSGNVETLKISSYS